MSEHRHISEDVVFDGTVSLRKLKELKFDSPSDVGLRLFGGKIQLKNEEEEWADLGASGQGQQGNQGYQGAPSTVQGPQGAAGSPGAQGNQGFQGIQGNQGNAGGTGPQGFQGNQGNTGNTGSQGNQGNQGNSGGTGPQGNQGYQGYQGNQGNQGAGAVWTEATLGTQASNDTSLGNITGLSIALDASSTYAFEYCGIHYMSTGTAGAQYGIQFSVAGATLIGEAHGAQSATVNRAWQLDTQGGQQGVAIHLLATTSMPLRMSGHLVTPGTPGNITVQAKKITSGNVITRIGSTIRVKKLA